MAQENAAQAAFGCGSEEVSGTLRFAASSTFAQIFIAPALPEFLDRYPDVSLDLKLSDTKVNLIEGGFDLALRNYAVEDCNLRARKLADDKRILCASPGYLASFGIPQSPEDLKDHRILTFMNGSARKLSTSNGNSLNTFPPSGAGSQVVCDDGASMRIATKAGVGISMNAYWSVYKELQEGSLVRVLSDHEVDDQSAIWLVYPQSSVSNPKVRVFIDFLLEKIGDPPVWEK